MKTLKIKDYLLLKTQTGVNEFKIGVFRNDKHAFNFYVSLQPTGNPDELPEFLLNSVFLEIPKVIKEKTRLISFWIKASILEQPQY